MNSYINNQFLKLIEQLNFIDLEIDNQIKKCEKAIEITLIAINHIKKYVSKNNFKTETEEIHFFKELKPLFTSKLIYFNMIYKIEMKKPLSPQNNKSSQKCEDFFLF